MSSHNEPPGFLDFGWQSWLILVAFVVVVVLFLGPGMWSSSTEPLWTTLWRALREMGTNNPKKEVSASPPQPPASPTPREPKE
jgi:hypothetical protein